MPMINHEQIELIKAPGLLTPSRSYKPLRYPWAIDFWRRQQQIHWMPEEIPLGEDCKDWSTRITDAERNLLTQVFRFFTQSDIEVQDNYMERYARVFRPDRNQDDARRVRQHGDRAHRGLCAAARNARHAR